MDIQNKDIKTFVQYEEYKEEDKSIKITRNIEINYDDEVHFDN